jgi:hypothetical protein
MSAQSQTDESRQTLERLARSGLDLTERAVAASPGSIAQVLSGKIKSLSSYNVYNVTPVTIGLEGSLPIEVGGEFKAFNLAESFFQQGQLQAGSFVVISRVGDKNVFWAKP